MAQNEDIYAICCGPEVVGDVISGENVKTTEGYALFNFDAGSISSFLLLLLLRQKSHQWKQAPTALRHVVLSVQNRLTGSVLRNCRSIQVENRVTMLKKI